MVRRHAELERLVRELLGVVEVPFQQRQRRLEPQHEVPECGLPELLHEVGGQVGFGMGVVDSRQLEQIAPRDARDR